MAVGHPVAKHRRTQIRESRPVDGVCQRDGHVRFGCRCGEADKGRRRIARHPVAVELETPHVPIGVLQRQCLAFTVRIPVTRDVDHTIQWPRLEPEIVNAARYTVRIPVQSSSWPPLVDAIQVADNVLVVHLRTETQPELVFALTRAAKARVFDDRIKVRVAAGRNTDVVGPGSQFQTNERIRTVVVVIARNQFPFIRNDHTVLIPYFRFPIQGKHGVQLAGIRQTFGKRFDGQKPCLLLLQILVAQIDREAIKVDVVAVRPVNVLAVQDVRVPREDRFGFRNIGAANQIEEAVEPAEVLLVDIKRHQVGCR